MLSTVGLGSTCSPYHSTSTLVKPTVPLPELLYKFSPNKVLPFEGNRFCVLGSNAIACYVSKEELWRSNPEAAAHRVQWVSFVDRNMVPPATQERLDVPSRNRHLGIMHWSKQATGNAKEEMM